MCTKKRSHIHYYQMVILAFSIFCLSAMPILSAGLVTGNSGLFLPTNTDGKTIIVTFSNQHPQQAVILEKLNALQLPRNLKQEMLHDFTRTLIMLSNEKVSYEDFIRQAKMRLVEVTKTTSPDGSKDATTEVWQLEDVESKLGMYIVPSNMAINDINEVPVAAYTQIHPKSVIYFTPYVNALSVEKQIELVLHEQAHRLAYFDGYVDDERFVTAWALTMRQYLYGKVDKKVVYDVLRAAQLQVNDGYYYANEKNIGTVGGKATFSTDISIILAPKHVDYADCDDSTCFIQVNSALFKKMPILQTEPYVSIHYLNLNAPKWTYNILRSELQHAITTQSVMPLSVTYTKTFHVDSNGRRRQVYAVKKVERNLRPAIDTFHEVVDNILPARFSADFQHWILYSAKLKTKVVRNLTILANYLKHTAQTDPAKYAFIDRLHLHYNIRMHKNLDYGSHVHFIEGNPFVTAFNLDIAGADLTFADFDALFSKKTKEFQSFSFMERKEKFEALATQKGHHKFIFDTFADSHKELDALEGIMKASHYALFERFSCIAQSFSNIGTKVVYLDIRLGGADSDDPYRFKWTVEQWNDNDSMRVNLFIPEHYSQYPGQWPRFENFVQHMFSTANIIYINHKKNSARHYNTASWNTTSGRLFVHRHDKKKSWAVDYFDDDAEAGRFYEAYKTCQ